MDLPRLHCQICADILFVDREPILTELHRELLEQSKLMHFKAIIIAQALQRFKELDLAARWEIQVGILEEPASPLAILQLMEQMGRQELLLKRVQKTSQCFIASKLKCSHGKSRDNSIRRTRARPSRNFSGGIFPEAYCIPRQPHSFWHIPVIGIWRLNR